MKKLAKLCLKYLQVLALSRLLSVLSSRQKESLWQQVEAVTGNFSADQIVNALVTNTQLTSLVTKDMAAHVDIRRDAQKLRYMF